jgi:hypothetical protein
MKKWAPLLFVPALLWAAAERRPSRRRVLPALEASSVAAIASESGYAEKDIWERAKAIGVGAAVLREETLADLAARGEVLAFGKAEIEKWKALGLVAQGAPLKPGSLWVKDPAVVERLLAAAERRGEGVSTAAAAGYIVLEFAEGPSLARPAGIDPASLKLIKSLELSIVLDDLEETEGWSPRLLGTQARLPAVLRAVYSHPARLLVIKLDPVLGVEKNLGRLRGLIKPLRERGVEVGGPAPSVSPKPGLARLALAWLILALGPLLCARAGLESFRRIRGWVLENKPIAAPVPELAAGIAGGAAAAMILGLLAALAFGPGMLDPLPYAAAAFVVPAIVGVAALYSFDGKRKLGGRPVTVRDVLAWLGAAALVCLLLKPRAALEAAGLWEAAAFLGETSESLWWWRWRWRELAVGYPALLQALYLLERRLDCPGCLKDQPLSDPRPWLLIGLIGPAGTIAAVAHPGAPLNMALWQSVQALILGLLFGGGLIGLRVWLANRTDGPKPNRPIDPVSSI